MSVASPRACSRHVRPKLTLHVQAAHARSSLHLLGSRTQSRESVRPACRGPEHPCLDCFTSSGSRPFQQNQEEIARLRKQVDILARVLRLSEDELEVLSIQAGGALSQSPPPTSRQSSPPAPSPPPRPQDIFDSMFSPGDPLIDLCRAAAVSHPIANAPPQPTPAAPPAPPPADLNIRAATGDTSVNSGLRPRS